MRYKLYIGVCISFFIVSISANAELNTIIYKSKDSKGQLVLSDRPLLNSKVIILTTDKNPNSGHSIKWSRKVP